MNHLQECLTLYSDCNSLFLTVTSSTYFLQGPCFGSLFKCLFQIQWSWPIFQNPLFKVELISHSLYWSVKSLFSCIYYIPNLMPTALLICMENTCWNIGSNDNFVELFRKSFTLYVESGMKKKIEADIEIFRNQDEHLVTIEFRDKFYKFIIEHYLRKFHCFYLHLMYIQLLSLLKFSSSWGSSFVMKEWRKILFGGCKTWC